MMVLIVKVDDNDSDNDNDDDGDDDYDDNDNGGDNDDGSCCQMAVAGAGVVHGNRAVHHSLQAGAASCQLPHPYFRQVSRALLTGIFR